MNETRLSSIFRSISDACSASLKFSEVTAIANLAKDILGREPYFQVETLAGTEAQVSSAKSYASVMQSQRLKNRLGIAGQQLVLFYDVSGVVNFTSSILLN